MEITTILSLVSAVVAGFVVVGMINAILSLRQVVSTNEVHIVQSAKKTTSYGKDTGYGNTYYAWPSWLPVLGVVVSRLPTNNFDIDLKSYEAYDKGRLPFVVDVKAFFRIADSNVAAQRVANFEQLENQLESIVQGAVRAVLASSDIEEILQGRSTFGEQFSKEVSSHLQEWGVSAVRNIELMDIRDNQTNKVIHNIMEKKKSLIEMESRTEVAKNKQAADIAEINAKKETDLKAQEAAQAVGLRTTENERQVALAQQAKIQAVKEQEKITKEREMEVKRVADTRQAEITRQVQNLQAEQYKETATLTAEGDKATAVLKAEAALETKRREAEGIALEGKAKADAQTAMELAPVTAQVTLAKEIGENKSYQTYLTTLEQIKANAEVGKAQAAALEKADIKVIANTGGDVGSGINSLGDLLTAKGGTQIGTMLQGLANTEQGQALMNMAGLSTADSKGQVTPSAKALNGAKPANGTAR